MDVLQSIEHFEQFDDFYLYENFEPKKLWANMNEFARKNSLVNLDGNPYF